MSNSVAIVGGSYNPPHNPHVTTAGLAAQHFDRVIVKPCGKRSDKRTNDDIDPVHRATMVDLAFRGAPNVHVDLGDLDREVFTYTSDLDREYRATGVEPWHVIGSEFIVNGGQGVDGKGLLFWHDGPRIWRELNWAIVERPGFPFTQADLPPHARHIGMGGEGKSSTDVRTLVFNHQDYQHLVPSPVADHIERYGLYRGVSASQETHLAIEEIRPLLLVDTRNPKAVAIAEQFKHLENTTNPNCVIAIGGDGTMLRAVRKFWRLRLPFYGINAGHTGFLLNDHDAPFDPIALLRKVKLYRQPMFHVEMAREDGTIEQSLGFNDAWFRDVTGQTPWVEVKVNGHVRIPCLKADMVVVATPAGSTAYARSAGGPPLCVDMPAMVMAASCVQEPFGWRPVVLPISSVIEITALAPVKRPIKGFVDGRESGIITKMTVRPSRTAAAELAFLPERDMAAKLAHYQFPPV